MIFRLHLKLSFIIIFLYLRPGVSKIDNKERKGFFYGIKRGFYNLFSSENVLDSVIENCPVINRFEIIAKFKKAREEIFDSLALNDENNNLTKQSKKIVKISFTELTLKSILDTKQNSVETIESQIHDLKGWVRSIEDNQIKNPDFTVANMMQIVQLITLNRNDKIGLPVKIIQKYRMMLFSVLNVIIVYFSCNPVDLQQQIIKDALKSSQNNIFNCETDHTNMSIYQDGKDKPKKSMILQCIENLVAFYKTKKSFELDPVEKKLFIDIMCMVLTDKIWQIEHEIGIRFVKAILSDEYIEEALEHEKSFGFYLFSIFGNKKHQLFLDYILSCLRLIKHIYLCYSDDELCPSSTDVIGFLRKCICIHEYLCARRLIEGFSYYYLHRSRYNDVFELKSNRDEEFFVEIIRECVKSIKKIINEKGVERLIKKDKKNMEEIVYLFTQSVLTPSLTFKALKKKYRIDEVQLYRHFLLGSLAYKTYDDLHIFFTKSLIVKNENNKKLFNPKKYKINDTFVSHKVKSNLVSKIYNSFSKNSLYKFSSKSEYVHLLKIQANKVTTKKKHSYQNNRSKAVHQFLQMPYDVIFIYHCSKEKEMYLCNRIKFVENITFKLLYENLTYVLFTFSMIINDYYQSKKPEPTFLNGYSAELYLKYYKIVFFNSHFEKPKSIKLDVSDNEIVEIYQSKYFNPENFKKLLSQCFDKCSKKSHENILIGLIIELKYRYMRLGADDRKKFRGTYYYYLHRIFTEFKVIKLKFSYANLEHETLSSIRLEMFNDVEHFIIFFADYNLVIQNFLKL